MIQHQVINEIIEICNYCVNKGWVESRAGNLSYRIEDNDLQTWLISNSQHWIIQNAEYKYEGNTPTLLITNSGSKFRNIAKQPYQHCCFVYFKDGNIYIHSSSENNVPSSELESHLLIHQLLMQTQPHKKAVVHIHPTNLIAFTNKYYDLNNNDLNSILQDINPDIDSYITKKTGWLNHFKAGSYELAINTLPLISEHDLIVWKKHGCLAIGDSFWDAIDLIDVIDKVAQIGLNL